MQSAETDCRLFLRESLPTCGVTGIWGVEGGEMGLHLSNTGGAPKFLSQCLC